jgi:hypothetical protein
VLESAVAAEESAASAFFDLLDFFAVLLSLAAVWSAASVLFFVDFFDLEVDALDSALEASSAVVFFFFFAFDVLVSACV